METLVKILIIGIVSCVLLPVVLIAVLIGFSAFNNREKKESDSSAEK